MTPSTKRVCSMKFKVLISLFLSLYILSSGHAYGAQLYESSKIRLKSEAAEYRCSAPMNDSLWRQSIRVPYLPEYLCDRIETSPSILFIFSRTHYVKLWCLILPTSKPSIFELYFGDAEYSNQNQLCRQTEEPIVGRSLIQDKQHVIRWAMDSLEIAASSIFSADTISNPFPPVINLMYPKDRIYRFQFPPFFTEYGESLGETGKKTVDFIKLLEWYYNRLRTKSAIRPSFVQDDIDFIVLSGNSYPIIQSNVKLPNVLYQPEWLDVKRLKP